jgi:predicted N-acetyltransferase YhbS
MTEKNWEISTYRPEDKPAILAINRAEYGDVALSHEAYFDWLASRRPKDIPHRVVREKSTGTPLTAGMAITLDAVCQGEVVPVMIGMNIVVVPEYRRQGIHTTLATQARDDIKKAGYRFTIVFPNPRSMRQLVKSPVHHLVCRVPLLMRPLDIRALTASHVDNPPMRWGINVGWQIASRTLWRERRPSDDGAQLTVAEDAAFDGSYDRFWAQVRSKYDIMLVRDRDFLQWRFKDIPIRKYQVLSARSDGELWGYIVLRQAEIRGTMTGLVADMMVLPGERGDRAGAALLHEALVRFRANNLALTGGLLLPHTHEFQLMRRSGYLVAPDRFAPQPFHLFFRQYSEPPPIDLLRTSETWFVSIADHDAV